MTSPCPRSSSSTSLRSTPATLTAGSPRSPTTPTSPPRLRPAGIDAVRALLAKEFIDDHVTLEVREVIEHHGDFIVRTKYEGDYDKTNLPDPLIMTNYFALRDGKIITLAVIFVPPAP